MFCFFNTAVIRSNRKLVVHSAKPEIRSSIRPNRKPVVYPTKPVTSRASGKTGRASSQTGNRSFIRPTWIPQRRTVVYPPPEPEQYI